MVRAGEIGKEKMNLSADPLFHLQLPAPPPPPKPLVNRFVELNLWVVL